MYTFLYVYGIIKVSNRYLGDDKMTKTGSTIRLDSDMREELTKKLSEVGLTLNGYFLLAAKQFLIQGKVPFEIKEKSTTEKVHFNDKTKKALIRAYAEEEGIISNTAKKFTDTDDLIKDLFSDE